MNANFKHAMASVMLFAFSISTVPVIGQEPRNRRTPINQEAVDDPIPEQDVPPPKHWALFVEKGGYAIPENFDPRLETDSKKHREQYKIEYPEGYEPKTATADWSARNEFQWAYDNAQNEGLRRAFSSNPSVYVPIRAYQQTSKWNKRCQVPLWLTR